MGTSGYERVSVEEKHAPKVFSAVDGNLCYERVSVEEKHAPKVFSAVDGNHCLVMKEYQLKRNMHQRYSVW